MSHEAIQMLCPTCTAEPGIRCIGLDKSFHKARIMAARDATLKQNADKRAEAMRTK